MLFLLLLCARFRDTRILHSGSRKRTVPVESPYSEDTVETHST